MIQDKMKESIKEMDLDSCKKKIKHIKTSVKTVSQNSIFDGVYIYDLETITSKEGELQCIASGLISLETVNEDISDEDRSSVVIKYGNKAIKDMLEHIDNSHKKSPKIINNVIKTYVKKQIYLYAHNGKGFDSYVIMNDPFIKEIKDIKFSQIVKNASGLLNLTIEMKNVSINLRCTFAHYQFSLRTLCENFKVPKDIAKDGFNIMQMNESNIFDPELKKQCIYYLQNDVLSLAFIWK